MTDDTIHKIHQHFSAECFNECWELIDKTARSPEDVENMILLAQASLWHWKQRADCEPFNLSIGYWQVSRVYALAGHAELARVFGAQCEKVSVDGSLSAFCIGYAYEALARAALVGQDIKTAKDYIEKAETELVRVASDDEKKLLESDIADLKKST